MPFYFGIGQPTCLHPLSHRLCEPRINDGPKNACVVPKIGFIRRQNLADFEFRISLAMRFEGHRKFCLVVSFSDFFLCHPRAETQNGWWRCGYSVSCKNSRSLQNALPLREVLPRSPDLRGVVCFHAAQLVLQCALFVPIVIYMFIFGNCIVKLSIVSEFQNA